MKTVVFYLAQDRQSPLDDEWVEIPPAEEPVQQETFTVNLGNQLKVTQNLRWK